MTGLSFVAFACPCWLFYSELTPTKEQLSFAQKWQDTCADNEHVADHDTGLIESGEAQSDFRGQFGRFKAKPKKTSAPESSVGESSSRAHLSSSRALPGFSLDLE